MKNKKGFTLIELLAVIVILAILMVAAGTAVISTMNNAKVNTFKNEALQVIDSAKTLYSEVSFSSGNYIITSSEKKYKGMCVTLKGLVENGYLEKDLNNNQIKGFVMVEVPIKGGEPKYFVWMTDGTYGLHGVEKNEISSLKILDDYQGGSKNNGVITDMDKEIYLTMVIAKQNGTTAYSINGMVDAVMNNDQIYYIHSGQPTGSNYFNIKCINNKI